MLKEITRSEALMKKRKELVANGVGVFNTATATSAFGALIQDEDGRELIDFAGGIGVVNAGHCPPPVVEAIRRQAGKYLHTSFNVVTYEPYLTLCEKLVEILPHGAHTKVMLVSTGAEAVENAIKIARQATGRSGVLAYTDAFHGRTMMAMTLTSKINYKLNCGPFAPEVYRLPFPNYYRYGNGRDREKYVEDEIRNLHEAGHNRFNPKELAAIIIEPVQGEGGFNPVPEKYLQALKTYCTEHGILLILDEVQSGFARTGHWAAWQHYNVTPDISLYAKSMGSGMPIAAVVGRAEIMDAAAPGTIGGTYIGNPVCCEAASATIDFMKEHNLNERGKEVGHIIRKRFLQLKDKYPCIGDVRGLGAMMALELVKDQNPGSPDGALCTRIIEGCAEEGLILISAGTFKNVIRILAPLVITNEQLEKGLDILEDQIAKNTCKS